MIIRLSCISVFFRFSVFLIMFALCSWAQAAQSERWPLLKETYFGDAAITTQNSVITLEVPRRAQDAATVPVVINAMSDGQLVKEVYLFVDMNPLPLAGIFRFSEEAGLWTSLETRIRINEYTHVRAVGVLDNGELHMAEGFVKAAGGCSAPAMADMDAAMARAGKMKLMLGEIYAQESLPSSEAVIKISHPNNSGMQFNQVTRHYIPAFFVDTITVKLDDVDVLNVETNFSMSENPVVRITFQHENPSATLSVVAKDSKGNVYNHSVGMRTN